MAGIFISYRRDDSAGYAGRLYDRLSDHFGSDQVFMDVDTIKPGQNFVDAVRQAVGDCDGLVAIIGREWLTISDATGARRLDDPEDIVSLEIATALERGIRVIPVLVQGAPMPAVTDFPESLKELAQRNAQEISDRSFNSDAQSLIEALEAPAPEQQEGNAFVGRETEIVEFRTALEGALAGQGRLAMLAGEPGIGKTRMAQELASHAERQGAQVLWGWCYEQAGAPPYWPWVDSIRSYISLMDPGRLRSLMGPGAADICEVIPALREKLPDLEPPPALDPDQARFRLFDSFANFFINAAQVQPLMLVLDDLQWADKPSLLLLEFLTRRLADSRLLVLGTYRDAEVTRETPLFESLAQFRRSPMFLSRVLEGLESGQVGRFIREAGGGEASQELTDAIYAHTEGNPFFISEVIRLLVERGELEGVSSSIGPVTLGIPQGVLEVVGQRLNRLSAECNDVLTNIAFAGRQFDFKLLVLLNEQTPSIQLLDLMDEALEASVIQEVPGQRDRYQFSHALMQQTLLEGLSTGRKVRMHARIGEELETLYGERVGEHAAELAYHFSEASLVTGPDKLVKYSRLAAENAMASYAWEEAIGHFERGLSAKGVPLIGTEPITDGEAAALLFGLSKAQAATLQMHQLQEPMNHMTRTFNYYADIGDSERAVAVAEYAVTQGSPGQRTGEAQLISRALELVPRDSLEAGRLLSRQIFVLGLREGKQDYQKAQDAYHQALAIAQNLGDLALEMRTLANACWVDYFYLEWNEAREKSQRFAQHTREEDPLSEVMAFSAAMSTYCALGDSKEANHFAARAIEAAEKLHQSYWLAATYWRMETINRLKGDWQIGRELSDKGLVAAPLDPRLLSNRVILEYETGNYEEAQMFQGRLLEAMRLAPPGPTQGSAYSALSIPLAMRISSLVEDLEIAHEAIETILSSSSATPLFENSARIGLALLVIQQGDTIAAREQYDALVANGGTLLGAGGAIVADRLLGLLCQTMGNLDEATEHFERALAFCRNADYRPELAWTSCDYADVLLERDAEGDRTKAVSLLDESLAISSELGMRPLMERVLSRREILKA